MFSYLWSPSTCPLTKIWSNFSSQIYFRSDTFVTIQFFTVSVWGRPRYTIHLLVSRRVFWCVLSPPTCPLTNVGVSTSQHVHTPTRQNHAQLNNTITTKLQHHCTYLERPKPASMWSWISYLKTTTPSITKHINQTSKQRSPSNHHQQTPKLIHQLTIQIHQNPRSPFNSSSNCSRAVSSCGSHPYGRSNPMPHTCQYFANPKFSQTSASTP